MSPQVSPCPRKGSSDKPRRVVRLLVCADEIVRAAAVGQAADVCARELPCVGVEEEGDCDAMFGGRRGRGEEVGEVQLVLGGRAVGLERVEGFVERE